MERTEACDVMMAKLVISVQQLAAFQEENTVGQLNEIIKPGLQEMGFTAIFYQNQFRCARISNIYIVQSLSKHFQIAFITREYDYIRVSSYS